jgi:hypothetical protein
LRRTILAPSGHAPWIARARLVFFILAALALCAPRAARADDPIYGTYEIETTAEGGGHGILAIDFDDTVRRRVVLAGGALRIRTGRARIEGRTAVVRFAAAADPADLSGEWALRGEGPRGAYGGTARFAFSDGRWSATFEAALDADPEARGCAELAAATLSARTLTGRRGPDDAEAAADSPFAGLAPEVSFDLSPDGLTLHGAFGDAAETLSRSRLAAVGATTTATYTLDARGLLAGRFDGGAEDRAVRYAAPPEREATGLADLARLPIEPDPVPSRLKVLRETHLLAAPTATAAALDLVKAGEMLPVSGFRDGFWVVGPWRGPAAKEKPPLHGFLPKAALDPKLHYGEVERPLFAEGKPPAPDDVWQRQTATCYLDAPLIALALEQPRAIASMVHDLGDGTVCVRFFERREDGGYRARWIRVTRAVVLDERGRETYTQSKTGVLWPTIVEKALAAWRGKGFYWPIQFGSARATFEIALGRPAQGLGWALRYPCELSAAELKRAFPRLSASDLAVIAAYRKSGWKAEAEDLRARPGARRGMEALETHMAHLEAAGLSAAGAKDMRGYYAPRVEGPLGSGIYSARAREVFGEVRAALAAGRPVAAGTFHWKNAPAPHPAEAVPGISADHAYAVIAAREDEEGRAWIRVVNPARGLSRRYDMSGAPPVVSSVKGSADPSNGSFEIELSDFIRYYGGAVIGAE